MSMLIRISLRSLFFRSQLLFSMMLSAAYVNAKPPLCEITNNALVSMPAVQVIATKANGATHSFTAKLANNDFTRAAGFQRVCESTIRKTPILFTFDRAVIPNFHMNNVVVPIDIAFIQQSSAIDVIHKMQPYSVVSIEKPLYRPTKPVVAALETYSGFYADHNIDLTSTISWSNIKSSE